MRSYIRSIIVFFFLYLKQKEINHITKKALEMKIIFQILLKEKAINQILAEDRQKIQ